MRNAVAVAEDPLTTTTIATATVMHLAHPHPVAWATLFRQVAHELDVPLVPYVEWVDRLTKSAEGLDTEAAVQLTERSPALRILDFFQACSIATGTGEGREAMGLRRLALDRACGASATLSGLKSTPLGGLDVEGWIAYWRAVGFF